MECIKDDLDSQQFGCLPKSCATFALIEMVHTWLTCVEQPGTCVRVLLLDYSKAFDRVDHTTLLSKLANTSCPDFLVQWVTSFLCQRQQRVKLGNTYSSWSDVKAGVPQGTLLGPTAFLLQINDLKTTCPSVKYVDDTTIWESCGWEGTDSKIQTAADQALLWSCNNKMVINADKTKEMVIYFGRKPLKTSSIKIDNRDIESVNSAKVLGVIINNQLKLNNHIDYITKKASSRLYFLRLLQRAGVPYPDIFQVYTSIIRSLLEYACEVWHPGLTSGLSEELESIQKRALKIILPDHCYNDALLELSTSTLHHRRVNLCQKMFQEISKPEHKLHHLLPPARNVATNLRKNLQYELPKVRTMRLKNSPINYGLFNFQ